MLQATRTLEYGANKLKRFVLNSYLDKNSNQLIMRELANEDVTSIETSKCSEYYMFKPM